jgi:hypothetical protein
MDDPPVGADEFARRLETLCSSGLGPGLPRKRRDAHILLYSIVLVFVPRRSYDEPAVGRLIEEWLDAAGPFVAFDRVTLRRSLVDEGYLERDAAGRSYTVRRSGRGQMSFEPPVNQLDPKSILRAARSRSRISREEESGHD